MFMFICILGINDSHEDSENDSSGLSQYSGVGHVLKGWFSILMGET